MDTHFNFLDICQEHFKSTWKNSKSICKHLLKKIKKSRQFFEQKLIVTKMLIVALGKRGCTNHNKASQFTKEIFNLSLHYIVKGKAPCPYNIPNEIFKIS
jgi:hypothetical protein